MFINIYIYIYIYIYIFIIKANYSFELLMKQDNMQEYSKLFLDVLKLEEAHVLRERFSRESDALVNKIIGDK